MDTGQTKKEATILDLSVEIGVLLRDLQDRLDNRFDRHPAPEETKPERPVIANVLDEIIENLTVDKAHLSQAMEFISTEVLPKIS